MWDGPPHTKFGSAVETGDTTNMQSPREYGKVYYSYNEALWGE